MERRSDLLGPSPYTGESPEAEQRNESLRRDYTVAPEQDPVEYNWVLTPTHVLVSKEDSESLLSRMGAQANLPHAYGVVSVLYNWDSLWEIQFSNIALGAVEKRLRKYAKDRGWQFEDMVNSEGASFGKMAAVPGIGEINPDVKDWRNKEWSGTEMFDNPGHEMQEGFYGLQDYNEDMPMTAPRVCSECGELLMSYQEWHDHVVHEHVNPDRVPPSDPQPVVDLDDVLPADFNVGLMDRVVQRQASFIDPLLAARSQKPSIPGPIPFIYDIESDRIFVGHPGERHSDIQGRFTPGGIVEGMYDPKGGVQIRTDTDMPYTVRHMIELWYAMHPELEVKNVFLLVGDKRYKLASSNIGHKVRAIAATDPAAWAVYEALGSIAKVYVVGGAVRDIVLDKTPKDIDLMVTGASADQIQNVLEQLPGRVDYTGKQFGVFRYRDRDGNDVEVAMPRTERSTGPGHKDFEVYTDPNITVEQDLARRDFTANAMAVELDTGKLIDPYRGAEDLKRGELKTVSDRSFTEDPLRILRALVSVARHQLAPDQNLLRQLEQNLDGLGDLPEERIQAELDKIMASPDPGLALGLAATTGVLEKLIPELHATIGFDQASKYHSLLLFDHIQEVVRHAVSQSDNIDLRWAALLHDIGKPPSQWFDAEGYGHYYQNEEGVGQQHELVGADMAREILTRLKFPNDRIDRIVNLVRWHMYPPFTGLNGARKFINRVGDDLVDDLLTLRWADSGGKDKGNAYDGSVEEMRGLVQQVRDSRQPTDKSGLVINGNDLIAAGIRPGPNMGKIFNWLVESVLEDPSLNDRATLLEMAKQWSPDMQKKANILDPIQEGLDPQVFKNHLSNRPDVHPRIIKWVKNKIYSTLIKNGWPDPREMDYLGMMLTGSLTTYQWSEDSDFDVSLWIITENLPEWVRADLIGMMIEDIDGTIVPGTTHPMQVFVVDSRKYTPNDLYRPGMRSAYDLEARRWLVPPERSRARDVYKTYPEAINYARGVEDKVRMMLRYDHPALETYYKFLHHQRQRDMIAGKGDYSLNNIVYKWLANAGLLGEISGATGLYIA